MQVLLAFNKNIFRPKDLGQIIRTGMLTEAGGFYIIPRFTLRLGNPGKGRGHDGKINITFKA